MPKNGKASLYKCLDDRIYDCQENATSLIRELHEISSQLDWKPEELCGNDSIVGMKVERARHLLRKAVVLIASAGSDADERARHYEAEVSHAS